VKALLAASLQLSAVSYQPAAQSRSIRVQNRLILMIMTIRILLRPILFIRQHSPPGFLGIRANLCKLAFNSSFEVNL
jgi:hypothetical protein